MAETKIVSVGTGDKQKQIQVTDVTGPIQNISTKTVSELTPYLDKQNEFIIKSINKGTETAVNNQFGEGGLNNIITGINTSIDHRLNDFIKKLEGTQYKSENKCPTCENIQKSVDLKFKASESTITDARNALGKKLEIKDTLLYDIEDMYPNIAKNDKITDQTLENTSYNINLLIEIEKNKIIKKMYPQIKQYFENWEFSYKENEECNIEKEKIVNAVKAKAAEAREATVKAATKAAEAREVAVNAATNAAVTKAKAAEAKAAAVKPISTNNNINGGNQKSKNYIKYKNQYLKLKEELNQLHK